MDQEALTKLSSDMRAASKTMSQNEARYLLSQYLTMQDNRKAADQKSAKLEAKHSNKKHAALDWVSDNAQAMEKQILTVLHLWAQDHPMGRWALAIDGVGPVVAVGLIAHLEIEPWKCAHGDELFKKREPICTPEKPCGPECHRVTMHTAGHFWAFMGFDPSKKWEKGQKRPHNAALKQIGYYAGESFVKCAKSPYRKVYDERKAYEQAKNERGEYAEAAKKILESVPGHAQAKTYKLGKLPDGHIHSRAKRYAVKQFIADWHAEAYRQHFGKEPPLPYPIAILGHAHLRHAS